MPLSSDFPHGEPRGEIVTLPALADAFQRAGLDPSLVRLHEATGSTNADLIAQAAAGEARHGSVVIARHQESARGRLDRTWTTPGDTSLLLSILIDPAGGHGSAPDVQARIPLIPLAVGAAAVRAVRSLTGIRAEVKWPNDVLVEGRKLGGILCQAVTVGGPAEGTGSSPRVAVVAGIGLNVRQSRAELPVETATSLTLEGAVSVSGSELAAVLVTEILWGTASLLASGDLAEVRSVMATLGTRVRVETCAEDPSRDVHGVAEELADDGSLVVRRDDGSAVSVQAGDVWHVRPENTARTSPAPGRDSSPKPSPPTAEVPG